MDYRVTPRRAHDLRHAFVVLLVVKAVADANESVRGLGSPSRRYIQRCASSFQDVAAGFVEE